MQSLAERLLTARKARKMTQQQLATKAGVTQTTISDIERGRNLSSTELPSLAKALGMTVDELLTGKRFEQGEGGLLLDNAELGPRLQGMIPLISEVQAGIWADIRDSFLESEAIDWIPALRKLSRWAFALRIVGDSMYCPGNPKSLSEGEIVTVEPEISPNHRDVIVARQSSSNKATVKQLLIDGDHIILNPLNERYKPIEINENVYIAGVVINVVRSFR